MILIYDLNSSDQLTIFLFEKDCVVRIKIAQLNKEIECELVAIPNDHR